VRCVAARSSGGSEGTAGRTAAIGRIGVSMVAARAGGTSIDARTAAEATSGPILRAREVLLTRGPAFASGIRHPNCIPRESRRASPAACGEIERRRPPRGRAPKPRPSVTALRCGAPTAGCILARRTSRTDGAVRVLAADPSRGVVRWASRFHARTAGCVPTRSTRSGGSFDPSTRRATEKRTFAVSTCVRTRRALSRSAGFTPTDAGDG
jgi:hypothetical protein